MFEQDGEIQELVAVVLPRRVPPAVWTMEAAARFARTWPCPAQAGGCSCSSRTPGSAVKSNVFSGYGGRRMSGNFQVIKASKQELW